MKIQRIHFEKIESTSTWAKENAQIFDLDGLTCVTAFEQTAGRGRFNRRWISGRGQNITATLFFTLPKESPIVANLAQLLSLSCVAVLEKLGFTPQIKWPNDLLLNGKKVSGILCETIEINNRLGIALGIGMNVNLPEEILSKIDQPATSLLQVSGKTWPIEELIDLILKQFAADLEKLKTAGFASFKNNYEKHLAYLGQPITCSDAAGRKSIQGVCHSVAPDGRLNLLLPDGSMRTLSTGDLHLPGAC